MVADPRQSGPRTNRFLKSVTVRNYKSIGTCSVELGAMTVLVGRNGAGKSNFLDAIRFVADGLQTSLDHALRSRGGIKSVRRQSTGHPRNIGLRLEFDLPEWHTGRYTFEIAARPEGGFSVKKEVLNILDPRGERTAFYSVADGEVTAKSLETMPRAVADRLYLVTVSGIPEFRGAYDALVSMGFYNLNPQAMRELQEPDAGELLHRDGSNIASVIARLQSEVPADKERAEQYLGKIVPGVVGVEQAALGPRQTLQFRQRVEGSQHPWRFYADSMSDGTLRALGILTAVSQLANLRDRVRLVGIEEPETALHPAAAGALMQALAEAAHSTQILVTTHSAELLDAAGTPDWSLLGVESFQGETRVAPIDPASSKAIHDHLYTAGELLRMDQLQLDRDHLRRQQEADLFGTDEAAS